MQSKGLKEHIISLPLKFRSCYGWLTIYVRVTTNDFIQNWKLENGTSFQKQIVEN